MRANINDLLPLFLNDTPMMDVRAPVEFHKGAFPNSHNIPLLDDLQRQLIGTQYKEQGQEEAIKLGNELATEVIKAERLQAWQSFTQANPEGVLYCFRGGLRSKVSQEWLKDSGIDYPFIEGGYKAMRTFLLEQLQTSISTMPLVLVSGSTASGKTHFLHKLKRYVDLEGRANHRGSSFGAMYSPQPSQINFENAISIDLLKLRHQNSQPVFMEDEGRLIGQLALPHELLNAINTQYPRIILQTPMNERVDIAIKDYITDIYPYFQKAHGEQALEIFSEKILFNLSRIKKRLGGELHTSLHHQLAEALAAMAQGDISGFALPIGTLLQKYYDPMYDYQLKNSQGEILKQGSQEELLEWSLQYQVPKGR